MSSLRYSFSVYLNFKLRTCCFVPFFWSGHPGLVSGPHASKNKTVVKSSIQLEIWWTAGKALDCHAGSLHSRLAAFSMYFSASTSLFHTWKFWMYTVFRSCFKLCDFITYHIQYLSLFYGCFSLGSEFLYLYICSPTRYTVWS